jgi:hypothetical protein
MKASDGVRRNHYKFSAVSDIRTIRSLRTVSPAAGAGNIRPSARAEQGLNVTDAKWEGKGTAFGKFGMNQEVGCAVSSPDSSSDIFSAGTRIPIDQRRDLLTVGLLDSSDLTQRVRAVR